MRRLLLLAVVAGALGTSTAYATPTCTATVARTRVCAEFKDCGACPLHPRIDPQCEPQQPFTGACVLIDDLYVDLGPR